MVVNGAAKDPSTMKCVVLGAGAWGTAMALHLAAIGYAVSLVPRDGIHGAQMRKAGGNPEFLPGISFPKNLQVEESFGEIHGAALAFLACPSAGIGEFCQRLAAVKFEQSEKRPLLVTLSKGIVPGTNRLPLDDVETRLPEFECGLLSGPTYAHDVALGKPTAAVFASQIPEERIHWAQASMNSKNFRIYSSKDVVGVELGGCLKNPYAIGMGFAHAIGCGDNGRAALLTRMMVELARIGTALGGKRETFYGLSGLGDLLATAEGKWSRNRSFGERIGKGENPKTALSSSSTIVEGYHSSKIFYEWCHKESIPCPILDGIHAILYEKKPLESIIHSLLERDLGEEIPIPGPGIGN
jgi:glycerol-3-phosphate dehydrogenase (NAD(P)+)